MPCDADAVEEFFKFTFPGNVFVGRKLEEEAPGVDHPSQDAHGFGGGALCD